MAGVAHLSDLSLKHQLFVRAYPWRRIDPVPWAPLRKPLAQARLALVSSAGFVAPGDPHFDKSLRGGDPSWREIPGSIDVSGLVETHRSDAFDHRGIAEDRNLAFPLDRLRELHAEGFIGSLASTHYSCMGSLTAVSRFIAGTAKEIAQRLANEEVDVALLVPV
jgi:D-proline reductase (dithiol) PrdB